MYLNIGSDFLVWTRGKGFFLPLIEYSGVPNRGAARLLIFGSKIPDFTFIRDYITVSKRVCRKTLLFSTYTFIWPYTSIRNPRVHSNKLSSTTQKYYSWVLKVLKRLIKDNFALCPWIFKELQAPQSSPTGAPKNINTALVPKW